MKVLAIETSCDETACAVIEDGTKIISNVVASSKTMHETYGGIVPEIAAREQLKCIIPVIEEALSVYSSSDPALRESREVVKDSSRFAHALSNNIKNNIDALAVTVGPGLIGSLLVGVETAKTIAYVTKKPIIPVNHVLAHMYANFIGNQQSAFSIQPKLDKLKAESGKLIAFPAISLVVSGGHTELYLMKSINDLIWLGGTLDDAAGECFDKTARLLGFGNGGGMALEKAARKHDHPYFSSEESSTNREGNEDSSRQSLSRSKRDSNNIHLPRPMMTDESLNFSFSGLKTAIVRELKKHQTHVMLNSFQHSNQIPNPFGLARDGQVRDDEKLINAFAFEVQEAITDVLVAKTLRAAETHRAKSVLLSGGVAANTRLREKFQSAISNQQLASLKLRRSGSAISFFSPPIELCTDNAVYIGSCAYFRGKPADWHDITAIPDLNVDA